MKPTVRPSPWTSGQPLPLRDISDLSVGLLLRSGDRYEVLHRVDGDGLAAVRPHLAVARPELEVGVSVPLRAVWDDEPDVPAIHPDVDRSRAAGRDHHFVRSTNLMWVSQCLRHGPPSSRLT